MKYGSYLEFASGETETIIHQKLLPALEELARAEFGTMCFYGDVDDDVSTSMRESIKTVEHCVSVYLRGLMRLYLDYGNFVTEESVLRLRSQPELTPGQPDQEPP